jgi:hypothetical protein
MYTVIRFVLPLDNAPLVSSTKSRLSASARRPEPFLNSSGNGFALEVCSDDRWSEHHRALCLLLDAAKAEIDNAVSSGFQVVVDVAVEPEDYVGQTILSLLSPHDLLSRLNDTGVGYEISIYGIDSADDLEAAAKSRDEG